MINLSGRKIDSVLNVGCGVAIIPHDPFWREVFGAKIKVACDLDRGLLKSWIYTDWLPVQGDANKIMDIFVDESFDLIIATDLIEHLEKEDGERLLKNLEILLKEKGIIVIFTPCGFLDSEKYQAEIVGDNKLLIHRSGWEMSELRKMGYKVKVIKNACSGTGKYKNKTFDAFWAWKEF